MYMEAQYKALSMEYDLIQTMRNSGGDSGKVSSRSMELTKSLREYIAQVKTTIKQVADAAGAKPSEADKRYLFALKYWGADSAYLTALVMYEYLNLKTEAMEALDKLPDQWPDSDDVLRKATVYEVRKHIAAGEIDKAIEHIEEMKKTHPEEANVLMQEVIGQLRNSIHEIEHDDSRAAELKMQRDAYLHFATELLKTHPNDYSFKQMLADASLESGQLDEALTKFEELAKIEQDNRAAKEKGADDFVDKLAGAMEKAQGNLPEIIRLAEDLPKAVKRQGIEPSTRGYLGALATILTYAKKPATDPEDARDRAGQVVKEYKSAMTGLRKDLKLVIPRDSVNMGGLARLYKARKEYTKALENYNPLVAGLWVTANDKGLSEQSRKSYLAQYGQALLERTECKYEYFSATADAQKKKEQMTNLLLEIKTFRDKDPLLWGQYAEFNAIEAKAQKIVGTK
jgi:tetratricopeptide (TPR) repeat protein